MLVIVLFEPNWVLFALILLFGLISSCWCLNLWCLKFPVEAQINFMLLISLSIYIYLLVAYTSSIYFLNYAKWPFGGPLICWLVQVNWGSRVKLLIVANVDLPFSLWISIGLEVWWSCAPDWVNVVDSHVGWNLGLGPAPLLLAPFAYTTSTPLFGLLAHICHLFCFIFFSFFLLAIIMCKKNIGYFILFIYSIF